MLRRMTPEDYAEFWKNESLKYEQDIVYDRLSKIVPNEATLEIGCGTGRSTLSLAQSRPVLAIDNNSSLINIAREYLNQHNVKSQIINSDVFEPSSEMIDAISNFQPKVIVGWFIGSHPDDHDKRTPSNLLAEEKPKVYREKIEDKLVTLPLCSSSVEWVHTVFRGEIPHNFTETQVKEGLKEEYNNYMFSNSCFSVRDVEILEWNPDENGLSYIRNYNPNIQPNSGKKSIISILARHK